MASSYTAALFLLCFFFVFSDAKFLSVPVFKHAVSGRYFARIFHGTDRRPTDLVVDLGGSFTGLDCRRSSAHRVVSCPSLECSKAGGSVGSDGVLMEDVVAVGSSQSQVVVDSDNWVDQFLFYCMPEPALRRLAANGVLGLGRSTMSLPSQFSMTHFLDRKFTICLSSASDSQLLIGDALSGTLISKTLTYTPLFTSGDGHHLISVNSIKIQGDLTQVIKVNGRARLCTTASFTTMQSSIYRSFTDKFVIASSNATKAESVWPFKVCFVGGRDRMVLPEVELVLQSKMVKWRIGKRNLVVEVGNEVSCLGILEGGDDEIVIGRYQLEDNVLEFDMGRSMLGFKSDGGTSCSELKLESQRTGQQHSSS